MEENNPPLEISLALKTDEDIEYLKNNFGNFTKKTKKRKHRDAFPTDRTEDASSLPSSSTSANDSISPKKRRRSRKKQRQLLQQDETTKKNKEDNAEKTEALIKEEDSQLNEQRKHGNMENLTISSKEYITPSGINYLLLVEDLTPKEQRRCYKIMREKGPIINPEEILMKKGGNDISVANFCIGYWYSKSPAAAACREQFLNLDANKEEG